MDAKTARATRETFVNAIAETLDIHGAEFVGRTSEGALFAVGEEDFVAVRAIVKSDTFDADAALAEFQARLEAAAQREKEKAETRKEND